MSVEVYSEVVDAEIVRTFDEHAEIVGAHHEAFKFHRDKAAEEAILTGRALLAAKNDLGHGRWIDFLPAVGMSRQYAHRFMQIGENLNVHNCGHLPKAVATLYELSRLAPEDVERGIETGRITPDMTIREAREYAQSERPATYKKKEKEMPATLEHKSPFAAGEAIRDFGNGTVITAGENGLAESTAESVATALSWYRENPAAGTEDCEAATGVSERVAERSRAALIDNKEIPDPKPNRLVDRFDSIAQGLTYVADDLTNMTTDLERATAEDLEFGREYFEDAMKKLNAFRKQLNAKY